MASNPTITKEMIAEYIRQNPNSALSYDILPLLGMASNEYLFGAGNRIGSNVGAGIDYLLEGKDFSESRKTKSDFLKALGEYQSDETPEAAVGAKVTGAVGSAVAAGLAAPVTMGANVGRTTPALVRTGRFARGGAIDQGIRSLIGEDGVWDKSQVEGELLPSGSQAWQAIPQALEETATAIPLSILGGEVGRQVGRGVQASATKLGLDDVSKYLSTETGALKRAGLSPDDLEAGRLVSGSGSIPKMTKEYSEGVGKSLREGASAAQNNLDLAARAGVPMTSGEAYAPTSNIMRDFQSKAQTSPKYAMDLGELRVNRPQQIGQKAAEIRPQLQAAKDKLYQTEVGPVDSSGLGLTPRKTIGDLSAQKDLLYTQARQGIPNAAEQADVVKMQIRSKPEGQMAEDVYGAAKDLKPLMRAGGINPKSQTTPFTGEVDPQVALQQANDLQKVAELLRGKTQSPAVSISPESTSFQEPSVNLRSATPNVRANLNVLDILMDKFRQTPQQYFDKIAPILSGQNLPKVAQKAPDIMDVFLSGQISNLPSRGAMTELNKEINPKKEQQNIPISGGKFTLQDLQQQEPVSIDKKFTVEELRALGGSR